VMRNRYAEEHFANKVVTIIMPTYNSEKTILQSLESIHNQRINCDDIEILVIDGGSIDNTIEIAKSFNCRIIPNPKRLPEAAKEIGLIEGCGKYGIFMDSDESFINPDSISGRLKIFEKNGKVKNVVSQGILAPKGNKEILQYMNYTGDPFSYFIYRINEYDRSKSYKKTYDYEDKGAYYIFNFKGNDILPISKCCPSRHLVI